MSTVERGFFDLTGRKFGPVEVVRFMGRNPVRYEVVCQVCRSHWVALHTSLVNAGEVYKCQNVSCQKGLIEGRRASRGTDRGKAIPTIAPAPQSRIEREYQLFVAYMKANKFSNADIGSWDEWQNLDEQHRKRLLQPALIAEEAALKRRELEAFGLAIENQERERFKRTYGEG